MRRSTLVYHSRGNPRMNEVTIAKAIRLFILIEAAGLAIILLGAVVERNECLISFGGLVMIPGFAFLMLAGILKAREEVITAEPRSAGTEPQEARQGEH